MKTSFATIGKQKYKTEIQAGNHIIMADEPEELGGGNLGFTPTELLESSLAACTAMTIRMYADRKGWDLEQAPSFGSPNQPPRWLPLPRQG